MGYKSLTELRNQYPDERNVELSYENKGNSIDYKGRYDENSLNFTVEDISGLTVVDNTSFQLILEIDGVEYTSPSFKLLLEQSISSGNPYIQKASITRVILSKEELLNAENFGYRELYAEVNVTKNLKTVEEIILHIDWLLSSRHEIREISEYGEWDLDTTDYSTEMEPIEELTRGALGFGFSEVVQKGTKMTELPPFTPQESDDADITKSLTTTQTTITPEGGVVTVPITIPITIDMANPFTGFDFFNLNSLNRYDY